MSPFNSRVALNNLNSSELVSIAATYQQQLASFRTNYQQYEETLSSALKMNCTDQPVAFYDKVADAREKRKKVHESTLQLKQSIETYKNAFTTFRGALPKENAS
jgi:flagellar biosynthesis chaperone FliJ